MMKRNYKYFIVNYLKCYFCLERGETTLWPVITSTAADIGIHFWTLPMLVHTVYTEIINSRNLFLSRSANLPNAMAFEVN